MSKTAPAADPSDPPWLSDEDSIDWVASNRVMLILRRPPSCPRRVAAGRIAAAYQRAVVLAASDFFYNAAGEYKFEAEKARQAYDWCLERATEALSCGRSPIVIDNSNKRRRDYSTYCCLAKRFGYCAIVASPTDSQLQPVTPVYYAWQLSDSAAEVARGLLKEFLDSPDGLSAASATARRIERLHVTAKFCGEVKCDYSDRPDVQDAVGRVFDTVVSGLFFCRTSVGLKVDLTQRQLALWDHDDKDDKKENVRPALPSGSKAHVTLCVSEFADASRAGADLLAVLAGAGELLPAQTGASWSEVRRLGADAGLLTLRTPIHSRAIFTQNFA